MGWGRRRRKTLKVLKDSQAIGGVRNAAGAYRYGNNYTGTAQSPLIEDSHMAWKRKKGRALGRVADEKKVSSKNGRRKKPAYYGGGRPKGIGISASVSSTADGGHRTRTCPLVQSVANVQLVE